MLPPRTPNYGQTPKYIQKYKEEAKVVMDKKQQERDAKFRPPSKKLLSEQAFDAVTYQHENFKPTRIEDRPRIQIATNPHIH